VRAFSPPVLTFPPEKVGLDCRILDWQRSVTARCAAGMRPTSCPLGVMTRHSGASNGKSALPLKADFVQHSHDVRPGANICAFTDSGNNSCNIIYTWVGLARSRHSAISAATIAGPRNSPTSPKALIPPKIPKRIQTNGSRAAPPIKSGRST
jgi:hypothetical protein